MALFIRKRTAQIGVILFMVCLLEAHWVPYIFLFLSVDFLLPVDIVLASGLFVLIVAALLPSKKEEWGSIWRLSGNLTSRTEKDTFVPALQRYSARTRSS